MSVFGAIKDAIFGHPAAQPAQAAPTAAPAPSPAPTPPPAPEATVSTAAPAASTDDHQPIDVDATLTRIAGEKGETDLQWQTSIVDLMKLTGMDSSLANREELAKELGYTGEMNGSAEMNEWLHAKVMDKLKNG